MKTTTLFDSTSFEGLSLRPKGSILAFDVEVTRKLRLKEEILANEEDQDSLSSALSTKRQASRIILNPKKWPANELCAHFAKVDPNFSSLAAEMDVLQKEYMYYWSSNPVDRLVNEGQSFVLVCFDADTPVGFAQLNVYVQSVSPEEGRRGEPWDLRLTVDCLHVYVSPNCRGRGFSIDLSIASSWIARDVLLALHKEYPCPDRIETRVQTISPTGAILSGLIGADFECAWDVRASYLVQIHSKLKTTIFRLSNHFNDKKVNDE